MGIRLCVACRSSYTTPRDPTALGPVCSRGHASIIDPDGVSQRHGHQVSRFSPGAGKALSSGVSPQPDAQGLPILRFLLL